MKDKLQNILDEAKIKVEKCETENELQLIKSAYLGKKSEINSLMKRIGELPRDERPEFGKQINIIKKKVSVIIETKKEKIKENIYKKSLETGKVDITLPGFSSFKGNLHPITKVKRKIEDTFIGMGFQIAEGFDIEDEFHNFDALNTPENHPARGMADTFYLKNISDRLLRTQTSTVQIRVMEEFKPPIKIISLGRVYRNETQDASHSSIFHQVEALFVDHNVSFADLKDTLDVFVKRMFGSKVKSRLRPHFFPFTEPSAEIDISCMKCGGKGCDLCKNTGWIEIAGAGMVDPNVFDAVGIDSERYTGFAFGMGIDRITMIKYNIPDIRMLFENDLRFLKQF